MDRKTVFIVGGTGAQGIPVVESLSAPDSGYAVKVLTRDTTSKRAKRLASLPNVTLVNGSFTSESDLRAGFTGAWGTFVNLDGFNIGEKAELYWGIRCYEIALESGVQFFIWGNLDFIYGQNGYNKSFHAAHYDGKGRVGEWILTQDKKPEVAKRMRSALFSTGPYIQMAIAKGTPMAPQVIDGVVTWRVPLGPNGTVCHVDVDECGIYVKWLFDNSHPPSSSSGGSSRSSAGMDLKAAIAHIPYSDLARAFTAVTGRSASYQDIPFSTYFNEPARAAIASKPVAYGADPTDPASMTHEQNFTGFWNVWRASNGNSQGPVRRDYALLDEIYPGRVKSAEEWFRREEERGRKVGLGGLWDRVCGKTGGREHVMKVVEDRLMLSSRL